MNCSILWCLCLCNVYASQEPEYTDVVEVRTERFIPRVYGKDVTSVVVTYFRDGTKILENVKNDGISRTATSVYNLEGAKVYWIDKRENKYFAKEIKSPRLIVEIDADLDGQFDLVSVDLSDERTEYFEICDIDRLIPVPSSVLNAAHKHLKTSPNQTEEVVVTKYFLEFRKSRDAPKKDDKPKQ